MSELNWQVVYKFKASRFEPETEKTVAEFNTYVNAEDFINLVIPSETRKMFFIKHK